MAIRKHLKTKPKFKQDPTNEVRLTAWLIYAAVVVSFCCAGQYGYDLGVLAAPTQEFYNQSYTERYGEMTQQTMDWLWAMTAASFSVGGALGAIAAPSIGDIMGRKYGLLLINVFSVSAALMFGSSKIANNFELVIMGRIVSGLYCGIMTSITPLFLSEISPTKYRGAIGTNQKLFLPVGIILAQTLGIFVLNTEDTWHILLAISGLFSALHFVLFPPCPGSPRWSMIVDVDPKSSKRALTKYYGTSDIGWVVDEIVLEHTHELKEERVGVAGLFINPSYRLPLLISVTVMSSVQFSGIPAMYQYAGTVFEMIWPNDPDAVNYAILGMGFVELCASCISIPYPRSGLWQYVIDFQTDEDFNAVLDWILLIDRVGRRPLLLYNLAALVFCNALITLSLNLANPYQADAWAYISMICIYCSIFFFSIGPATLSYIMVPELWSQGPRPAAVSIGVQVQWWSGFLVNLLFPFMQSAMGAYMFALFMVFMIYYTLFTYFLVPETKLKSFEEIVSQFRLKSTKDLTFTNGLTSIDCEKAKKQ